jgi:apoptosis-inducing factor 2
MSEKNILILGGSWGGMSTAHYLLKHVINTLPTEDGSTYKVIILTPSSHFYHRVAGPRAIVAPDLLPQDKYILSIEDNFKKYKAGTFALIQGTATGVDTAARTVTYKLTSNPADIKTIPYHALVIATGINTTVKAWSNLGAVSELRTNLADMQARISSAKSVVVAGGGPAGVETAGEIGDLLNGAAGFFSSRPSNPKAKITLVQADDKLLPVLRVSLAKKVEQFLNRVGVDVVYNTKVVSTSTLDKPWNVMCTFLPQAFGQTQSFCRRGCWMGEAA